MDFYYYSENTPLDIVPSEVHFNGAMSRGFINYGVSLLKTSVVL